LFTGQVKRLLKFDSASGDIEGPVLSPDRRQIVFAWYTGENGHYQLRLVPNEPGSMPRVLIDSPEYSYYDASEWFPDGKSVLVLLVEKTEGTAQLARVSVSDGAIKVLKRLESRLYSAGNTGRVSPDGQHIVFSAWAVNPSKTPPAPSDPKDQHIYILSADGSRETEIIKTAGINRNPVWTADNKHILFTSDRSGKTDVWSIGVQDGQAVGAASLVSSDIGDVHAAGMARGSFYYTVIRRGDYIHIAGSAPGSARQAESIIGIRPAWSPDGKSLAFKRHRPGGSADDYDLVVHSLETGDERNYFSSLGAAGNGAATWFHDGLGILAGLRRGDGSRAFYRIDLKTGEYKELVKLVGPNVLSPDDRTLYLLPINTPDPGVRNRVVVVDLTTGQERVIATLPQPASSISLSPDGRTLALGWLAGAPTDAKLHIARVSVDGSGFREVFTRPDHLFGPGNVAWDRDGHSLLFTQEQPEGATHWGVMRVPAEGGGPATLVFPASNIQSYDLSPDGSRIAYSSNESATELWALDNVLPMLK
jgi:Tol biopolymer transport system component